MATVYVYGFAPGTSEEDFCGEFFADFDQHEICTRIDFKGDRIFAFIHTHTDEQAQGLINRWNGQKMNNSKFGLQVRMKGQNNHVKPREPNLFVYGFPKTMTQEEFNQEFFLKFPEVWDSCIKVDFLAEKLQAFIHCADTADCDKLITHWEGRPMQNSSKPLQVRYKGENLEQNRMHKMSPVLYVYGFPKGMNEDQFREEFFGNYGQYEQKIDFHANKLYAFVHTHNTQQCQELINNWNGKKMSASLKPIQVSMRDMHQPKNQNMGNGMMNMGMMMGQNGPRGRFMTPQMGMMVPGQYAPMMVPQMQQGYGMQMGWGGMQMGSPYGMMGQQQMMNGQNNKRPQQGFQGQQGLMNYNNGNMRMNNPRNGPGAKRPKMHNGMKMENGFRGQNPNQFNQGDGNFMADQQQMGFYG